jgi:hypothetical protein
MIRRLTKKILLINCNSEEEDILDFDKWYMPQEKDQYMYARAIRYH